MVIYKCKMCGGDLNIEANLNVIECEYCGTTQTVPTADNEKKVNLFNRANRLRLNSEFDKAAGIYESIIAEFPEEAEAYWGLCLCNYGIEYVDDPATAKKIPTCHRASFEKLANDENFSMAMEYADVVAQKIYRDEAREIDCIMENILSISKNEKPYDVFICYKETDEKGERTIDSVLAQDIYDALTSKGLKVFFARITLEDKLGQMYEPYIFAALNSAKVLLSVGTKYEHFHAVWVKNEWSRFLKLMAKDKSKVLIPCYKDMDAYDLPDDFKALQAQDMGKIGFMQDLVRGIEKILGVNATQGFLASTQSVTGALTKRGYIYLEDRDFIKADSCFERALDDNPEDSEAYLGKFLVEIRRTSVDELKDLLLNLETFKNFNRAIRFAQGDDKAELESLKEKMDRRHYLKCFSEQLSKLSEIREKELIPKMIKKFAESATVDGYEKIITIITKSIPKGLYTVKDLTSAKIQADIFRFLSASQKVFTTQEILKSKYFSGFAMKEETLDIELRKMVSHGSVDEIVVDKYLFYGAKGSKENLERIKKKNTYDSMVRQMDISIKTKDIDSLYYVASAFEGLRDYNDSVQRADECKRIAQKYKIEKSIEAEKQKEIIRQNNLVVQNKIAQLKQQLAMQEEIYNENRNKIFGSGAKMRASAKMEMERLQREIKEIQSKIV